MAAEIPRTAYHGHPAGRASMRPRRMAAEILPLHEHHPPEEVASMRPRRMAAEIPIRAATCLRPCRFNEAAANGRGNPLLKG